MSDSSETDHSHIKPLVTSDMVLQVLVDLFDQPVHDLEVIQGGEVAQTFSFSAGSETVAGVEERKDYIIRFNAPMSINFEKEAYAYDTFASRSIPIPRVVHLGRVTGLSFTITEKLPGQNLLQIPRSEYHVLIPKLMEVLDAIHQVPVGDKPGYGIFDGNGVAPASSWVEHLDLVRAEDPADDFFGSWRHLFQTSFLERELFESIYREMMERSRHYPGERYLVHGDFGFGNVLVKDGEITAILDWMNAQYGDFLYDVAWLDYWAPHDAWRDRFQEHYRETGRAVPFYAERILCYQCYITLNAMKFYAKADSKEGYDFVTDRITTLLGEHEP